MDGSDQPFVLVAILDLRSPFLLLRLQRGFILNVIIRNELFVVKIVGIDQSYIIQLTI